MTGNRWILKRAIGVCTLCVACGSSGGTSGGDDGGSSGGASGSGATSSGGFGASASGGVSASGGATTGGIGAGAGTGGFGAVSGSGGVGAIGGSGGFGIGGTGAIGGSFTQPPPGPHGHILYLNFNGALMSPGGGSHAAKNVSTISVKGVPTQIPPFFGGLSTEPSHPTRQSVIDAIKTEVTKLYSTLDLQVVVRRPSVEPYSMMMIGGSTTDADTKIKSALGIATAGCGSYFSTQRIGHTFPVNFETINVVPWSSLASTTAHEAGHLYGLNHNTDPKSLMTKSLNVLTWGAGAVADGSCTHTYQDDLKMLTAQLGAYQTRPPVPGPPDVTPPTVTAFSPKTGVAVPHTFTPCISASDASGISFAMVQLWSDSVIQNFEPPKRIKQQFLTQPPFTFAPITYPSNQFTVATVRLVVVDKWDNLREELVTLTTASGAPAAPACP